jgi:hypothetical protein
MEEEFYATLKLISGEEIVSKICYLPDEDKILLDKPLQVEQAKQMKGYLEVTGFRFKEWMSATFEDMFIINRDHVLTMSEIDDTIQEFYEKTIRRLHSGRQLTGKNNKLPRSSGYLGSVLEVKKTLEDIFNKS